MSSVLRILLRLPVLVLLVLVLPLALLAFIPPVCDWRPGGERLADRTHRLWARGLSRVYGLRIVRFGQLAPEPVLVVANHQSWQDIVVLNASRIMRFVAKAEIRAWPVVGWLVTAAGTLYHHRGSGDSLNRIRQALVEALRQPSTVAIFPEGGIPREHGVARFHARLLAAALEAGCSVQPVCIRYLEGGRNSDRRRFGRGEGMFGNFFRLLRAPPTRVEVHVLEPLPVTESSRRRDLASYAESRIRQVWQHGRSGVAESTGV